MKSGEPQQVQAALRFMDPNASRPPRARLRSRSEAEELMSEHDFKRFTALYCAALQGRLDLVQLLVQAGADVNRGGFSTPLVVAAQRGDLEVVRFLVESGADPRPFRCF